MSSELIYCLGLFGLMILTAIAYCIVTIGGAWVMSHLQDTYYDGEYIFGSGWLIGMLVYILTAAVFYTKILPLIGH